MTCGWYGNVGCAGKAESFQEETSGLRSEQEGVELLMQAEQCAETLRWEHSSSEGQKNSQGSIMQGALW